MSGDSLRNHGISRSGNDDGVTVLKAILQALGTLVKGFAGLQGVAGTSGSFTFGAAATALVPNVFVKANSFIVLSPGNAIAGTLVGSVESPVILKADYVVGVSFLVRLASGTATGGEVFNYQIFNTS